MAFLIIIAIIILIIYIAGRKAEKEREERERLRIASLKEEAKRLCYAYPNVFINRFRKTYSDLTYAELNKIASVYEPSWKKEQEDIDSKDDLHFYKEWHKKQENFNNECIEYNKSIFETWGRYVYNIDECGTLTNGKLHNEKIHIWVHFAHSFCTDGSLDYSLGFHQHDTYKTSLIYKNDPSLLNNEYWDKILNFLDAIYETHKDLFIIFVETTQENTLAEASPKEYDYLKNAVESKYPYSNITNFNKCKDYWNTDCVVVINLVCNNGQMIDNCKKIAKSKGFLFTSLTGLNLSGLSNRWDINSYGSSTSKPIVYHNHTSSDDRLRHTPTITYISIFKEYSSDEMRSLISAKRKQIDDEIKAQKEKEKKELEELRRAQEQLKKEQERIRIENEERERKRTAATRLRNSVSGWYRPSSANLKCYSMYYYYPTTCDFEASQYDWDIRNMIWDFKANPHKPIPIDTVMQLHRNAVSKIVGDMKKCLNHFFGDDLKYLTLVCVPSSKAVINQRRYEDFSQTICKQTNMENGYTHIRVTADGEAKHMGGTNVAKYEIDADFFKDKNIILFDDVITSGKSMEQLRVRLQNAGANVIGGFSIGKTKHDKQLSHPINELDNPHTAYSSPLDDLPF